MASTQRRNINTKPATKPLSTMMYCLQDKLRHLLARVDTGDVLGASEDSNKRNQVGEGWRQRVLGETTGTGGHVGCEIET